MTWVIAHRGASSEEKENTLPAFERAIELGADFVEFDVQAASDGGLVVFRPPVVSHDRPRRAPGSCRSSGSPTLAEVLELTPGRIGVMAELKSPGSTGAMTSSPARLDLLPADGVVVSFSRRAILETRSGAARSCGPFSTSGYGTSIRAAAGFAWAAGYDAARVTPRGIAKGAATRARDGCLHGQRRGRGCCELARARRIRDLHGLSGSSTTALGRRPAG